MVQVGLRQLLVATIAIGLASAMSASGTEQGCQKGTMDCDEPVSLLQHTGPLVKKSQKHSKADLGVMLQEESEDDLEHEHDDVEAMDEADYNSEDSEEDLEQEQDDVDAIDGQEEDADDEADYNEESEEGNQQPCCVQLSSSAL